MNINAQILVDSLIDPVGTVATQIVLACHYTKVLHAERRRNAEYVAHRAMYLNLGWLSVADHKMWG